MLIGKKQSLEEGNETIYLNHFSISISICLFFFFHAWNITYNALNYMTFQTNYMRFM